MNNTTIWQITALQTTLNKLKSQAKNCEVVKIYKLTTSFPSCIIAVFKEQIMTYNKRDGYKEDNYSNDVAETVTFRTLLYWVAALIASLAIFS